MIATAASGPGADCGVRALAEIFATAYLRLLASRAHNSREHAQIQPPDSPQLSGYELAPE